MQEKKISSDFSIFIEDPYIFRVTKGFTHYLVEIVKKEVLDDKINYIELRRINISNYHVLEERLKTLLKTLT